MGGGNPLPNSVWSEANNLCGKCAFGQDQCLYLIASEGLQYYPVYNGIPDCLGLPREAHGSPLQKFGAGGNDARTGAGWGTDMQNGKLELEWEYYFKTLQKLFCCRSCSSCFFNSGLVQNMMPVCCQHWLYIVLTSMPPYASFSFPLGVSYLLGSAFLFLTVSSMLPLFHAVLSFSSLLHFSLHILSCSVGNWWHCGICK